AVRRGCRHAIDRPAGHARADRGALDGATASADTEVRLQPAERRGGDDPRQERGRDQIAAAPRARFVAEIHLSLVPLPAIRNGCAGKAGTTSYGRRRKRRLGAGFWPAITRRQNPPSLLPRLLALAASECGLWTLLCCQVLASVGFETRSR